MTNNRFSDAYLEEVKTKLKAVDKDLQAQEELLKAEDPYLNSGRAEGNSEEMDEAILEDVKKEIVDAQTNSVQLKRQQIKRALSFLKIGKYGMCEICGKDIDTARLEIFPEATKCIDCASKAGK